MLGEIFQFPEGQIIAMALIFLRIMAFVVAWPVFGVPMVPVPVKILLALTLTITMFPVVKFTNADLVTIGDQIILLAMREVLVGLTLGFLLRMFFFAVSVCGELLGSATGLSSAQLFNPAFGSTSNVMEQFQLIVATLVFLVLDGHHFFILGLAKSFDLVPVSEIGINLDAYSSAAILVQEVVTIGFKMAAPVLMAVFLANIAMGVLGRAVPQINVLITSLPLQILLGVGLMILVLPLMVGEMESLLAQMADRFFAILKVM